MCHRLFLLFPAPPPLSRRGRGRRISMDQWYVARGKVKQGPYSRAQLQVAARNGTLAASDMVLQEGAQNWTAADQVAGLFPVPSLKPAAAPSMPRPAPTPTLAAVVRPQTVPTAAASSALGFLGQHRRLIAGIGGCLAGVA